MNSNLFHNIANVATLVVAVGTAVLMASGCTATATSIDCSASWINPAITTGAIAAIQVVKLGVNLVRDGLSGLTKPQPPVQK